MMPETPRLYRSHLSDCLMRVPQCSGAACDVVEARGGIVIELQGMW